MKNLSARRASPVALAFIAAVALGGCASGEAPAATAVPPATQPVQETPDGASAVAENLELSGFWIKESSLDMSAGFGTIMSTSAVEDALIGASAPGVPAIEFHETVDGVMRQVESFTVPADGSQVLSPGGSHLMLIGLTEALVPGESLDLTLQFASGATATITAPIEPFSGDDGHGHGDETPHEG